MNAGGIAFRQQPIAWSTPLLTAVLVSLNAPSVLADAPMLARGSIGQTPYAGAEACMACHETEHREWQHSRHAEAFSTTFALYWKQNGARPACLACHTTGFDRERGVFALQGVSCEACHGAWQPGHPQAANMLLPVDSSVCMSCHKKTYREWQLSGHAKHHIRCFDCHEVHKQGLRPRAAGEGVSLDAARETAPEQHTAGTSGSPRDAPQARVESQCGSCHPQRLEDFAHATHHFQGLTCTTCHMPQPPASDIFEGAEAPAHSWFVGVETCAACHEEMVHKSHTIPSLMKTVEQLSQQADVQRAAQLESQLRHTDVELDVERGRTVKVAFGAFLAGLLLGTIGPLLRRDHSSTRSKTS